ncbi:DUF2306 domain-containing protein [Fulvivirga sedimenti]|uniref:DUF2306 domain-containing protein n=1 Tax=Fulvivirga sedimenti TaxID=2879465 RepID=A0A9X1KZX5_9BACT|nr:DUF2306 domain-containing protein [Fulvivirga sedimenti]MCA6075196.1 DUF2306 domain-containing protein [Fulvivirga sedimenti]MCA6076373.1 DUF2306 domain-containing protein [Fulvivirga sedimenti]MCA6077501.1 DUF2306 domain-containing protein [Fulvivirga sedimenti]
MKNPRFAFYLMAFFGITIGLYPFMYLIVDMNQGLLAAKPPEIRDTGWWQTTFYTHIIFGGVSLLIGWVQFSGKLRRKYLRWHRILGFIYLIAVLSSGMASVILAVFAEGGLTGKLGFGILGILWLVTTVVAFKNILNSRPFQHGNWMIRSYALTFAAVMLRLWMPFFGIVLHLDFPVAYPIIAWLCWVPNIVVAELLVARRNKLVRFAG